MVRQTPALAPVLLNTSAHCKMAGGVATFMDVLDEAVHPGTANVTLPVCSTLWTHVLSFLANSILHICLISAWQNVSGLSSAVK